MIPNHHSLFLFKFGPYKYINDLKNGEISFSCPGKYIDIAKNIGNDTQGDMDEGIFAKLKCGDSRIDRMKKQLGEDLEIIEAGEYVKLRRWSSYYIPTFCFYSFRVIDLLESDLQHIGWQRISHEFDDSMYEGFGDYFIRNVLSIQNRPAQLMIQAKPFANNLKINLVAQSMNPRIKHVDYTEFAKDEFFIEPTSERDELFYKFPKYSSQKEIRICLIDEKLQNYNQRKIVEIDSFNDKEVFIFHDKISFEVNTDVQKRK